MTKKWMFASLLILALALAAPALAQGQPPPPPPGGPGGPGGPGPGGPGMGPPPDLALKEGFSLTDDQLTALKNLQDARRQTVEGIMPQLAAAERAVAEVLNASSPDPQQLATLQLTVKGYRDQIRAADMTLGAGFKTLLSPAQQATLAQYLAMRDALPVLMALKHMGF